VIFFCGPAYAFNKPTFTGFLPSADASLAGKDQKSALIMHYVRLRLEHGNDFVSIQIGICVVADATLAECYVMHVNTYNMLYLLQSLAQPSPMYPYLETFAACWNA
jgi:hypothetical protein